MLELKMAVEGAPQVGLAGEGGAVENVEAVGVHAEELLKMVTELITWIAVGSMVFGGVVPYIPQYRTISRTKDADGFSTFVCFVLLMANILRIFFWFGKRYELPLLFQSIIMIATMMAMIHTCVRVKADKTTVVRRLTDFKVEHFWKWTRFRDYCMFVGVVWVVGCTLTLLLLHVSMFVELLGLASLLLEACLGVPQFWRNFTNKSTEGMSIQMVVMWLSGDVFKTGYFLVRHAPLQFWVCGSLQVMVDILILFQVFVYWKRTSASLPKQSRPH